MRKMKLPNKYRVTRRRGQVLELIRLWETLHHRWTAADAGLALGCSRQCAHELVQVLHRDGFVTKKGCKYKVSKEGRDYLRENNETD